MGLSHYYLASYNKRFAFRSDSIEGCHCEKQSAEVVYLIYLLITNSH